MCAFAKFSIFSNYYPLLFWKVSLRRQVGREILPKNLPKIFQRFLKIVPKSLSGGGFGWLGSVLGGSWGVLGRLGPSWGRLGSVLQPYWGRLGAAWGRLGVVLGRLGDVLEASWGVLKYIS